jgi:hypothetical protein
MRAIAASRWLGTLTERWRAELEKRVLFTPRGFENIEAASLNSGLKFPAADCPIRPYAVQTFADVRSPDHLLRSGLGYAIAARITHPPRVSLRPAGESSTATHWS